MADFCESWAIIMAALSLSTPSYEMDLTWSSVPA